MPCQLVRAICSRNSSNPNFISNQPTQKSSCSQPTFRKKRNTVCKQVEAFYNYVGNELTYSFNHNDWGAQATMGYIGADCTEYSDLMIALSRAAGIPARYYEGLLYLEDPNTEIAKTEHTWLDVDLPGTGWVAMDPTIGRLPVFRETYFAHRTIPRGGIPRR